MMKLKKGKSTENLLDNSEDAPTEDAEALLPAEISAATSLIPQNNNNTSVTTEKVVTIEMESAIQSESQERDKELPLSIENLTKTIIDMADEPVTFKTPTLPWYRNWTSAGVALCVIYNLMILLLLGICAIKFGKR